MAAIESLRFATPPSPWKLYPRIFTARKPRHVADGQHVPHLEAALDDVRIDPASLRAYTALTDPRGKAFSAMPIAYPHVLAGSLHLALLASDRFPVSLMGLVHVRNRIECRGELPMHGGGRLLVSLEGHRETARGQEFDLETRWLLEQRIVWLETTTFLARAKRVRGARRTELTRPEPAPPGIAVQTQSLRADADIGRRYGWVSGDVNPIHLFDLTARPFGFRSAIAHGMWSMARCAAEIPPLAPSSQRTQVLDVQFNAPIALPAWLMLERWDRGDDRVGFSLRDAQGARTHLAGTLDCSGIP